MLEAFTGFDGLIQAFKDFFDGVMEAVSGVAEVIKKLIQEAVTASLEKRHTGSPCRKIGSLRSVRENYTAEAMRWFTAATGE